MEVKVVMEVKDVASLEPRTSQKVSGERQRPARALAALQPVTQALESVKVQITAPFTSEQADLVKRASDVIGMVNLVSDATTEIGKLVESIDGIAEQASENSDNPTRVAALEREANELLDEIKKKVATKSDQGVDLFSGDTIRLDLEKKLGKSLEVILPDADVGPDISEFRFTPKDVIMNVREEIERTRSRVRDAGKSLDAVRGEVEVALKSLDVASENSEASEVSIRDVDRALEMAQRLEQEIPTHRQDAVAANRLTAESAKLLE